MKVTYTVGSEKSIIPFGKHRGSTVAEVFKSDPSYLIWMVNNTNYKLTSACYKKFTIINPILDYNSLIPFGKYKGCTVKSLLMWNRKYLNWLFKNTFLTPSPDISHQLRFPTFGIAGNSCNSGYENYQEWAEDAIYPEY